jgi:molybdopterin-guanine dinucleotide biosynthesis protein B/molybdopterin-guanine dinucleotide biosynthesis protein
MSLPHAKTDRPDADETTPLGLLLAGGSGRRAHVDKRYLVLGGRTLLERNLAFLRELLPRTVISLAPGQELDLGDAGAAECIYDAWPGASPLAGIATALRHFRRPVFALAVDLALPDRRAAERVLAAFRGHDLALPAVDDHYEPLFAVYGPACLEPMTALLGQGRQRIIDILPQLAIAEVRFADGALFRNINTMDEYEEARRLLADGSEAEADVASAHIHGRSADPPALVAIVGKSDSGKTTLIEKLLPELRKLGLRVGTVKHDAHSFEIDHPGKDSWRHGQAGAEAYVVSSATQLAYISKLNGEMPLGDIARRFFAGFDLVVAEGYKRSSAHRVELFRLAAGYAEPLCAPDEAMALITDAPLSHEHRFDLNDAAGLARFLAARLATLREY